VTRLQGLRSVGSGAVHGGAEKSVSVEREVKRLDTHAGIELADIRGSS